MARQPHQKLCPHCGFVSIIPRAHPVEGPVVRMTCRNPDCGQWLTIDAKKWEEAHNNARTR
ncbi:MAG: hypothetical protein ACYCOU_20260 [Sulfobacillus sp.]